MTARRSLENNPCWNIRMTDLPLMSYCMHFLLAKRCAISISASNLYAWLWLLLVVEHGITTADTIFVLPNQTVCKLNCLYVTTKGVNAGTSSNG